MKSSLLVACFGTVCANSVLFAALSTLGESLMPTFAHIDEGIFISYDISRPGKVDTIKLFIPISIDAEERRLDVMINEIWLLRLLERSILTQSRGAIGMCKPPQAKVLWSFCVYI